MDGRWGEKAESGGGGSSGVVGQRVGWRIVGKGGIGKRTGGTRAGAVIGIDFSRGGGVGGEGGNTVPQNL